MFPNSFFRVTLNRFKNNLVSFYYYYLLLFYYYLLIHYIGNKVRLLHGRHQTYTDPVGLVVETVKKISIKPSGFFSAIHNYSRALLAPRRNVYFVELRKTSLNKSDCKKYSNFRHSPQREYLCLKDYISPG
jgi:hypothetical protein